ESSAYRTITISRVIDGDTFKDSTGTSFRLLNINAPEKSEPGYEEAKKFLALFENKTVEIQELAPDKYGRTLARVFAPEYLNLKLVEQGLAKKFLVEDDELKLFSQTEANAIENQKGIWKKSQHFNCLQTKIQAEKETVEIKSLCGEVNIKDWTITDESRKKYKFPDIDLSEVILHTGEGKDNETDLFWQSKQNIWNNDRDTAYIFDKEQALVHYDCYGY
ncbi:MAG: thermonuclease family protein, partial [Nanoarchaeota archaeon]|nr:thermonuclease family protein [Nanoarchaeota archaeon]